MKAHYLRPEIWNKILFNKIESLHKTLLGIYTNFTHKNTTKDCRYRHLAVGNIEYTA